MRVRCVSIRIFGLQRLSYFILENSLISWNNPMVDINNLKRLPQISFLLIMSKSVE